jgi:D-xylose transport system substrate-binding protein
MAQPVLLQRLVILGCALLVAGLLATGCGGGDEGGGAKIAFLLPKDSPLYEGEHRSAFEQAVEEECGDCEVLYSNAGNEAAKQRSQAEAALKQGAEVLVVDPLEPKSAAAIAEKAKAEKVPVVSYDQLIADAEVDAYVSFSDEKTGEVQAETLVKGLKEDGKPSGPILMVNGPSGSPKAAQLEKGARKVFEQAGVKVVREYDIPEWRAEYASREVEKALAALGKDGFAAVYAADNNTAAGAISPLRYNNLGQNKRPVTGDGATFDAVQRVMTDEQFMTTYNEVEPEATAAAEVAVSLAEGKGVPEDKITGEVSNGKAEVPSVLLEPIAITTDNFKDTVIADGLFPTNELCEFYEYACDELKISYSKRAPQ